MGRVVHDDVPVVFQVCSQLSAADADWTLTPLIPVAFGDAAGCGRNHGTLRLDLHGDAMYPGDGYQQWRARDYAGYFIRALQSDPSGTTTLDGVSYGSPFWHGIVASPTKYPDGGAYVAGGPMDFPVIDIGVVLERLVVGEGFERNAAGTGTCRMGELPRFNALPGGDMSASDVTLDGSSGKCRAFDRRTAIATSPWTAYEALRMLLVYFGQYLGTAADDVLFALADPDGALTYVVPSGWDANGRSLAACCNILAGSARGLIWSATVSGKTLTVTVRSTRRTAISAGSYTLPAAGTTTNVDARGFADLRISLISQIDDHFSDSIEVVGARPWIAVTFRWQWDGAAANTLVGEGTTASGEYGWSAASRAAWNTNPTDPSTADVYRRFRIAKDWDGSTYNQADKGVRNALAFTFVVSGGASGTGYDGKRSLDATAAVPGFSHLLDARLPLQTGGNERDPFAGPVVAIAQGGVWFDYANDPTTAWRVSVEQDPAAIRIDSGNQGLDLAANVADGTGGVQMLVTVGLREPQSLRVSWLSAEPQRSIICHRRIDVPDCEQWVIPAGTVLGVNTTIGVPGTLITQATDLTVRDDLPQMRAILALAVAFYGRTYGLIHWDLLGQLATGVDTRPGTLVRDALSGDETDAIDAPITRRTWRRTITPPDESGPGVAYWITTCETTPMVPDDQAFRQDASGTPSVAPSNKVVVIGRRDEPMYLHTDGF